MILLVNTASTYDGGAVQVALSFIQECRSIEGNEYHVILGLKISEYINESDYPDNFHFYRMKFRPAERIFSFRSISNDFKFIENAIRPDVVFTTSGPAYWKPKAPHLCGFNIPQSLYRESNFFKLLPYDKQLKWKVDKYLRRFFFKRESKHFVVQTEDVNSRLRLWFRTENVYTVHNTCHSYYLEQNKATELLPDRHKNQFRFLTLSTFRPHKNFELIREVVDNLTEETLSRVSFVVTIPEKDYQSFFAPKYQSNVINVGPVKITDCPGLYNECDGAFLPSLLECFSAAYPEAMAMGLPIMASDLSFSRSICQEAAFYFNPYDGKETAFLLNHFIDNPALREELITKGRIRLKEFGNGYDRAKSYLMLCEDIMSKNKL